LEKEAASRNENRVTDVKNGYEAKTGVNGGTNGHANGNGNTVAKNEVPVSNGNGFRNNEYDGKP